MIRVAVGAVFVSLFFSGEIWMSTDLKTRNEPQPSTGESGFKIEVFYDGECPLCMREIKFLKKKDRKRLILFSDIQQTDFDSSTIHKTHQQLMAEIHGRLPDGSLIKGVEVFRRLYDAIGWNWAVAITRWPLVRQGLDWAYRVFAKRRLGLTGRCQNACEVKKS